MADLPTIAEWQNTFAQSSDTFVQHVASLRNQPEDQAREAIAWYAGLLIEATKLYGLSPDQQAFIIRAPGRVNLLGTHVDHRGGRVNPIAVRELCVLCFPNDDQTIGIANADPSFTVEEFELADLLPDGQVDDWKDWTLKTPIYLEEDGLLGNWSSYVRASLAYFSNLWNDESVKGFDLYVASQLPRAAGLSSSSALVVASAIAFHLVNGREYDPMQLAEQTGEAEWYVGTRGGCGDQAAIMVGESGQVSHIDMFPMKADHSPWPEGYSVVVCHSRTQAQKTSNARSIFNERVATYEVGLLWIKHLHPEWADKLVYLRDVLRLGLSDAEIYALLKELPFRATRDEIRTALPNDAEVVEKLFIPHDDPAEGYRVRDVCLYGLAECTRSALLADYLRRGDVEGAGEVLDLSHEGDRVTCLDEDEVRQPCDTGLTEDELDGLIEALKSDDDDIREAAALYQRPGGYAASCPELDEMVDIAHTVEGVLGAGLIGAGLGGCIEVLVSNDAVEPLKAKLLKEYYEAGDREPFIETVSPVQGACALRMG
jgi:N-acetylgalactosamine kinase